MVDVMKLRNLRWGDYPGGPSVIISIFIQRSRRSERRDAALLTLKMEGGNANQRMVAGLEAVKCQETNSLLKSLEGTQPDFRLLISRTRR